MIGFAAMIFSHPELAAALPVLTKLVFASSVMHQLVITSLSPLPFAIGQVQDTGMIFLASMASSVMTELGPTVPLPERIATVLVHLSISTVLVGVGLILTGKARLASLVQYLPTPVIGGYLAYVGFFMVKGGVALTTGVSLATAHGWAVLVSSSHSLGLLAPGLAGGIMLSVLTSRFRHFAVFPSCILLLPASFFVVVWISNYSLDDARTAGFLEANGTGVPVVDVYSMFDFYHIHWSAMPGQLPTMVSMFVMIAFASSLDIASICMGTTSNMNYNAQLQTVGMSNLISGLTGGYTGSYIFSQTLFTSRFRPSSTAELRFPGITRLVGITLAACELAIVVTPVSLMALVPKFLFGAVMIFIGIDLLKTWLVGVYHKLLFAEYLTVVGTFCCLNMFGVQLGLATGIALAAASFLVEYTKAQDVRIVHKTSNVIRNADQHALLYGSSSPTAGVDTTNVRQQDAIVTIELQGHIFFGSATRIQNCVKSAVYVDPPLDGAEGKNPGNRHHSSVNRQSERLPLLSSRREIQATYSGETGIKMPPTLVNLHGQACIDQERRPTRFVILDFSQVSGMDATAARSCFLALKLSFSLAKVCAVFCGMKPSIKFLLQANDVITTTPAQESLYEEQQQRDSHVTTDLDLALEWCEQQLILSAAKRRSSRSERHLIFSPLSSTALSLSQIFAAYLTDTHKDNSVTQQHLEELAALFTTREWNATTKLFCFGQISDTWYVLLRGTVELRTIPSDSTLQPDSPESERVQPLNVLDSAAVSANDHHQPTTTELVGRKSTRIGFTAP
ncbi:unnamed protein product [Phytophthora fragariaefolia]|uniref:Unnamed protein product n=1 Tax=Phytophthora fragariaefolia TaxID=1490495 RepID=A0A9W6XQG8_9STRA|nr:unnamed protein product [Phytophthora fragariaefolia]